jgi:putative membrane protein
MKNALDRRRGPGRWLKRRRAMSTLFAFLHHLAAFTLVAALAVEFILIRMELSLAAARRLVIVDAVLGASATLVLVVGLLRVFYFEKGATYYFSSHAFLTKLAMFVLVAALSIIPTMEFLSWRKALKAGQTPRPEARKLKLVGTLIHAELAGIVIILLAAAMMARGGFV